ncbi:(R)-limonene synthase [Handroanthus impetiginosus]|uniref:(R)-limonene synthase n=1 Tax=Handroanthus impetiginosus TaxID=429701 RepID=A0A2G9GEG6_9LAMI|nr:(R)-limonene synthase [Handroanthus impetiginosus]
MASIILHMGIPNRTNNYLCTFDRKAPKQWCVSSTTVAAAGLRRCSFKCNAKPYDHDHHAPTRRRSGNYKPALWDFDYVQSLSSEYAEERYLKRSSDLIVQVKMLLEEEIEDLQLLELIDDLQRLGISYHFENKINQILNNIYEKNCCKNCEADQERDLYATALEFRLLRQHGFSISQEVFKCFKNEKGDFKTTLGEDTKGLLQLYEASFMLTQSENTLELAREFATIFLRKKLDEDNNVIDDYLALLVRRALELPSHWRVQRPNARWFIDVYGTRPDMNSVVLELAKLDFNIVQAMHQQELKHVSRWWKETSLAEKLPFARDRLVECYFWTIGGLFQPQYGYSRIMSTKVNALITIIDDIFDVYGTLEELHLFNNAIQRWDMEAMDQLPNYMKLCCLALDNFIHEMAYDVLKEQGFLIITHLRNSWTDLCRTYLQEAKWYSRGYTPKLEEYIENAWISISSPAILCHAFFLVTNPIEKEAVERLYKYHNMVQYSAMILRLANDLATSLDEMKRGDVPKSIQCYMNETGASTKEAQEYVRFLIWTTWKKINEERISNSSLSQTFVRCAVDLGRMAQYMYHHGDGHGIQNPTIKESISSLLFEPIVLP